MPATTTLYAPYGLPHTTLTPNWLANVFVAAIFTPLSALVIALRLIATFRRHRPKALDDLFMLLAYIVSLGFTITSILSLRWGVGLKAEEVPDEWAEEAMKVTYGVEIFYYCSIFLVKVSILCVYLRITQGVAGDGRGKEWWLRRGTWCTLALLTLHFVSTQVVAAVQCMPLSLFWTSRTSSHHASSASTTIPTTSFSHQTDPRHGHCINITAFFYSTNAFTILTDLIILILPLRVFWKLIMPRKQKWSVIGAFAVGGVSTIASCVRLYSVRMFMSTARGLEDAAPINTWSFVEINLGILCASVPAIKPLIFPTRTHPASPGAINDSQPTPPNHRPRHRGSTSKLFASLLSGFTNRDTLDDHGTQDNGIPLDAIPEQSRKEKMQRQKGDQRLSQLGLRSVVMTSSRGSLRNYRASAEGGGRRTAVSSESTMEGRLETEAKEGV